MSFGGDRLADHNSCADCQESCGSVNATGLLFNDLNFELDARKGEACLRWACPGCGKGVTEPTSLLSATDAAREIAADPLCHTCRTGTAR